MPDRAATSRDAPASLPATPPVSVIAPLRRIVRTEGGEWITREHLECGHTNDAHGSFAMRRRCGKCLRGVTTGA